MKEYFEFEIERGLLYKGHVVRDDILGASKETQHEGEVRLAGLCAYLRKDRLIAISEVHDGQLQGYGCVVDLIESALYCGQLKNSEKHGYGKLTKFEKPKRDEYAEEMQQVIDAAKAVKKDTFIKIATSFV
jgi:hypothetical protein